MKYGQKWMVRYPNDRETIIVDLDNNDLDSNKLGLL